MSTRVGLFKILLRTLNSRNPKAPCFVQDIGHRSYVNQITDDSLSKFPNFPHHGNKDRFFKIPMSLLRIFFRGHVGTLPGSMHATFSV